MKKMEIPDRALLDELLGLDKSKAWAIADFVSNRYGEDGPLPDEWAEPLVQACLAETHTREQRLQFMWLLERLPESVVHRTINQNLYVDTDMVRGAVQTGDDYALIQYLDELLPGYSSIPAVRHAVGRELIEAIDKKRQANDD